LSSSSNFRLEWARQPAPMRPGQSVGSRALS
jgi:hypothetical protein